MKYIDGVYKFIVFDYYIYEFILKDIFFKKKYFSFVSAKATKKNQ